MQVLSVGGRSRVALSDQFGQNIHSMERGKAEAVG